MAERAAGTKRPALKAALAYLRPEDQPMVRRVDHLGRSLRKMLDTAHGRPSISAPGLMMARRGMVGWRRGGPDLGRGEPDLWGQSEAGWRCNGAASP